MLIETVTVSILTAKARKGKLKNLENLNIKAWYLIFTGLFLEVVPNIMGAYNFFNINDILDKYFVYLHFISYILIFTALILNFDKRYMRIIFAGTLLNFIVIFANNGQMPVSGYGLEVTGLAESVKLVGNRIDMSHALLTPSSRLPFLGDVIILPKPYPLAKIVSAGDVLIALGVFFLFQEAMVIKEKLQGKSL